MPGSALSLGGWATSHVRLAIGLDYQEAYRDLRTLNYTVCPYEAWFCALQFKKIIQVWGIFHMSYSYSVSQVMYCRLFIFTHTKLIIIWDFFFR